MSERAEHLRGRLICFSGIDGSGKTTLCKALVAELKAQEMPSRYVYGRFLPIFVAPLFRIVSSLVLHKKNPQENFRPLRQQKKRLLENPVVFKLFVLGILFDQLLRVLLKISLPSIFRKEVVICDRYLLDTMVTDVALTCDLEENEVVNLVDKSGRIFPRPDVLFLVDLPPEIAYQRKKDMHPPEALQQLSNTYLKAGKKLGATVIDGNHRLPELTFKILEDLRDRGLLQNK